MANSDVFSDRLTTSLAKYIKKGTFENNAFDNQALLKILTGKKRSLDGGYEVRRQVMLGKNKTFKNFYGRDPLYDMTVDNTGKDTSLAWAAVPWKQSVIIVEIVGIEELENAGSDTKIGRLLETRVKQAELTLQAEYGDQLINGTPVNNSGKGWWGINEAIGDHQSTRTVYAGIDCSAAAAAVGESTTGAADGPASKWRSTVVRGSDVQLGSTAGLAALDNLYMEVGDRGADDPSLMVTTQSLWLALRDTMQPQLRYEDVDTANRGIKNITFNNVPVIIDRNVPAKHFFMLNDKYLEIVGHEQDWMSATPFEKLPGLKTRVSEITTTANVICTNRRRQGKHTALVA